MATVTLTKSQVFSRDLVNGAHRFSSDTFKLMATNTAPSAAALKADVTEITAQNGYAAGGVASTVSIQYSGGVATVKLSNVTITAAGGQVGPFRYLVLVNTTQTSPASPVVGYYDLGSAITLNDGDSEAFSFDQTNGFIQVA